MANFDNFTIIIPEHNRPHHLKRLLEYYLAYGIKVIVADSSVREFCYLKEYEQKIVYRYYPRVCLAEKIFQVLSLITTPYVLMCANDDFILPNTINVITDFLDRHPDYNSGQGIYGDFDPFDPSLRLALRYSHMLDLQQIDDATGKERLLHLMGNYFQYYYCVYRTLDFREIYTSVIEYNSTKISNLCLLEFFVSSYPAITGKHIIVPMLYAIRENALYSAATFTASIPKVISDVKYEKEYEAYIEILAMRLAQVDHIPIIEADKIIRESVALYMNRYFPTYFSLGSQLERWIKCNFRHLDFLNLYGRFQRSRDRRYRYVNKMPDFVKGQEGWKTVRDYILRFYDICYK